MTHAVGSAAQALEMKILALDNALGTTGYAVFDNGDLKDFGTFETKKIDPVELRLGTIWKNLASLHDVLGFDKVYFEDCYKQPNLQTYHKLSMVKATILLFCYFNELKCECSTPSHWRKVIKDRTGFDFGKKREEQKESAVKFVQKQYGKECGSDEADAICIGYAALAQRDRGGLFRG